MSFVNIVVQAVWGTKRRAPFMNNEIRPAVINHIKENALNKGIFIDRINGYTDHLHCLISLNPEMSIGKTLQLIKGESAFWINQQRMTNSKFEWSDEYFAVSINASMLEQVRWYIEGQELHHKKVSFQQEYDELIKEYNDNKGVWGA
ncbi:MAG: IS200/IS605 family transposase [Chitinophagaceae bacterium]|nr:IS200/IS605 family transposase [Chitinophagaceae bacterium]